jgi:hypothetical protein
MDNTTDGGVQTMLESEFTYNLPHGVEDEDEDDVVHSTERSDEQNDQPMDDVADHNEVGNNSLFGDQDDAERPMNYDHFKPGFSDDALAAPKPSTVRGRATRLGRRRQSRRSLPGAQITAMTKPVRGRRDHDSLSLAVQATHLRMKIMNHVLRAKAKARRFP